MIPALVLTAGLATRLRPLSLVRAKAALPVGELPLASHILRQLVAQGVTDAVLNLHHLPTSLTSRLGDGAELGVRIRYSWEAPTVLGSAGGPRKAVELLGAKTFLLVNGDTLTDLDLGELVAAHRRSGALVTIAVIPNTKPEHYSGITADDTGAYTGLVPRGAATPSFHVIGTQVVEAEAFAGLEAGLVANSLGAHGAYYPELVAQRPGSVRLHQCVSSFLDIGTPRDYIETCRSFATSRAIVQQGARSKVATTAQLDDVILWDDVEIGEDVSLSSVVVTDGVRVPAGSRWSNVILRRASGVLDSGEQRVGELAVSAVSQA